MNQEIINEVLCQMIPHLSNDQIVLLKNVLEGAMLKSGTGSDQSDEVLGHEKIDTTLHYAMVKQSNVKNAHRRYIG